jgi:hypothetical protein
VNRQNSHSAIEYDQEQLAPVIEAIIEGKYSWACVLLLRLAGHNPLHYIPYRTYNRLLKENYTFTKNNRQKILESHPKRSRLVADISRVEQPGEKINDLAYLEVVSEQRSQARGGFLPHYLSSWLYRHDQKQESLLEAKLFISVGKNKIL